MQRPASPDKDPLAMAGSYFRHLGQSLQHTVQQAASTFSDLAGSSQRGSPVQQRKSVSAGSVSRGRWKLVDDSSQLDQGDPQQYQQQLPAAPAPGRRIASTVRVATPRHAMENLNVVRQDQSPTEPSHSSIPSRYGPTPARDPAMYDNDAYAATVDSKLRPSSAVSAYGSGQHSQVSLEAGIAPLRYSSSSAAAYRAEQQDFGAAPANGELGQQAFQRSHSPHQGVTGQDPQALEQQLAATLSQLTASEQRLQAERAQTANLHQELQQHQQHIEDILSDQHQQYQQQLAAQEAQSQQQLATQLAAQEAQFQQQLATQLAAQEAQFQQQLATQLAAQEAQFQQQLATQRAELQAEFQQQLAIQRAELEAHQQQQLAAVIVQLSQQQPSQSLGMADAGTRWAASSMPAFVPGGVTTSSGLGAAGMGAPEQPQVLAALNAAAWDSSLSQGMPMLHSCSSGGLLQQHQQPLLSGLQGLQQSSLLLQSPAWQSSGGEDPGVDPGKDPDGRLMITAQFFRSDGSGPGDAVWGMCGQLYSSAWCVQAQPITDPVVVLSGWTWTSL